MGNVFFGGGKVGMAAPGYVDENTLLLLHGEDLTDSSNFAHSITNNGVTASADRSVFGGKSLYFNGASSLSVLVADLGIDFNSDFTIDWWENYSVVGSSSQATISMSDGTSGFHVGAPSSEAQADVRLFAGNGGSWNVIAATKIGNIVVDTWAHRAVVRSGNKILAFENGVLQQTFTPSTTLTMQSKITFGQRTTSSYNGYFKGYMDEIRISNVARWTEAFTPPTKAY